MKSLLCAVLCASLVVPAAFAKPRAKTTKSAHVTSSSNAKRQAQLLRLADANWSETAPQIQAMVKSATQTLRAKKLTDSDVEILSASQLVKARGGLKFSEWSAAYMTLRLKGQSKSDAKLNLAALYRSMMKG